MPDGVENPPVSELDALLERFLDGEVTDEEATQVERLLEERPELLYRLTERQELRSLLRDDARQALAATDFSTFWDGIDARLEGMPAPGGSVRSVGFLGRLQQWWEQLGWGPIGALAAVPLVLLVVQASFTKAPIESVAVAPSSPSAGVRVPPPPAVPTQVAVAQALPDVNVGGVEVTSVEDSGAGSVMVLTSPGDATVIWVSEETGGGSSI